MRRVRGAGARRTATWAVVVATAVVAATLSAACGPADEPPPRPGAEVVSLTELRRLPAPRAEEVPTETADQVLLWGDRHPDVFAGVVYVNRHLYAGFTREPARLLTEVREHVGEPELIRAFAADHTLEELRVTERALRDRVPELLEADVPLSSVRLVVERNRVVVTLEEAGTGDVEAVFDGVDDTRVVVEEL